MNMQLGIDLGAATVKLALLTDGTPTAVWLAPHHGKVLDTLQAGLLALSLPKEACICVTGRHKSMLLTICPDLEQAEEIPAITEGVRHLVPKARCILEIGSQSARFITDLDKRAPQFSVNENCAGGTGSFFEDQMTRLGLDLNQYSELVAQARSVPNLSGRCAVFAKTDLIHRQQEGVPKQDILLGLCYAMVRNYKAVIVKNLPVQKPVVFCGGVTCNTGVIRAIREIFALAPEELILPEHARYVSAIGAAVLSTASMPMEKLTMAFNGCAKSTHSEIALPQLILAKGTKLEEPKISGAIPPEGCYLGIDVGSTSTDLVLMCEDQTLVDFQYLRTAGDPEQAVRSGLEKFREKYGAFCVRGVGITGSGRERLGRMMGADAIRDEITAQAKAAAFWVPEADTVFEIGGQDSKFISLENGNVTDFQMNKICAAGTGSFVEEQAARMGIPLHDFGPLALTAQAPCDLGERCTVFIETAIAQAEGQGASQADIAAGVCHAVVKNYLQKVVAGRHVGEHIVLQGGVDYNPGIVAAFQSVYGNQIQVSPVFPISGAFGAALLAKETVAGEKSKFLGFDFPGQEQSVSAASEEIRKNKAFYKKAGQLALRDYDAAEEPGKKTIGVPLTLIMFKFFPMVNAFFRNLGFRVILSEPSNVETVALSQQHAQGETCYPVKLIYGHMAQLAAKGVDYIFLPAVHTIRHPHSHAVHNYACPYMQTAAKLVFDTMELEKQGIQLISPVLDLDLGAQMMAVAMLDAGKTLGFSKARCLPGLLKGALAVRKYSEDVEALGREVLTSLKPEDKVLVLITRNYGISDPVLNMRIPELLLNRGCKVLTLGHLPGMALDISADYPGMYWPFGDHLLSGAKLIAHHPNLYAVYLTNHGCGPDTVISHMFREEMGDKPYLQIEVDEHVSPVGVVTRIEAFLNSLSHRPSAVLPENFDLLQVKKKTANLHPKPNPEKQLLLPRLGLYTPYLEAYFRTQGLCVEVMPPFNRKTLEVGRAEMYSKEYLPLPMLTGAAMTAIAQKGIPHNLQFLIPMGYGADADGQYARTIRTILDRRGYSNAEIVSPILEELPETAWNIDLLFRALLTGDVLYAAPPQYRAELAPDTIPSMEQLLELAKQVASYSTGRPELAAVGTPLCVTELEEGILETLESEGRRICRMPLSEWMLFLWKDNARDRRILKRLESQQLTISSALGKASPFASDMSELLQAADRVLPHFAGANGRYRCAKAIQLSAAAKGVLMLAPRYENTAIVLQLAKVSEYCTAPVFHMSLDGDWDEGGWSKLRSFLYYCALK